MHALGAIALVSGSIDLFAQPPHRLEPPARRSKKRRHRSIIKVLRSELERAAAESTPRMPRLTNYPY